MAGEEYELVKDEHENVLGCELCDCDVPVIKAHHPSDASCKRPKIRICEICYTTYVGNVLAFDSHSPDSRKVARMIAGVGNLILQNLAVPW